MQIEAIRAEVDKYTSKVTAVVLAELKIDKTYVLSQAKKLHEKCMSDDSFDAAGANRSLQIIGNHVDIQAFSETVNHKHDLTIKRVLDELNGE